MVAEVAASNPEKETAPDASAKDPICPSDTPAGSADDSKRPDQNYWDWPGSLDKDIALQCHKIKDDDARWEVLAPGLKKLLLRKPDETNSPIPEDGELVSIHYSTFLHPSGELVASSRKMGERMYHKFEVGKGEEIKGLEVAVLNMPIGERALLRCAPDYAYGEKGFIPSESSEVSVPPNATVNMVVQVEWVVKYEPLKDGGVSKNTIVQKTVVETVKISKPVEWQTVTVSLTGREVDRKGRLFCEQKDIQIRVPLDIEFEGNGWTEDYDHPRGFYHCLKHVRNGETMYFKIKSSEKWTYGEKGFEKFGIPGNTDLFYRIAVQNLGISLFSDPSKDEKQSKVEELKDMANTFFRRNKLKAARRVYGEILRMATEPASKSMGNGIPKKETVTEKETKEAGFNAIKVACYSNCALVELKLNNLGDAERNIEDGLKIDPKHEKLQYRKALLHRERAEFEEAMTLLARLETDFPENQQIKVLKTKIERLQRGAKRKIKGVAKRMFKSKSRAFLARVKVSNITLAWSSFLICGGVLCNLRHGKHMAFKVLTFFGIGMIALSGSSYYINDNAELFESSSSLLVNLILAAIMWKICEEDLSQWGIIIPLGCLALSGFYGYRLTIRPKKEKTE